MNKREMLNKIVNNAKWEGGKNVRKLMSKYPLQQVI